VVGSSKGALGPTWLRQCSLLERNASAALRPAVSGVKQQQEAPGRSWSTGRQPDVGAAMAPPHQAAAVTLSSRLVWWQHESPPLAASSCPGAAIRAKCSKQQVHAVGLGHESMSLAMRGSVLYAMLKVHTNALHVHTTC
jgi:hypothetical protein